MNVLQKIKDAFSTVNTDEELDDTRELLHKTKLHRHEESLKRKKELIKLNREAGNFSEVTRLEKEVRDQVKVVHREEDFFYGLGIDIKEDSE